MAAACLAPPRPEGLGDPDRFAAKKFGLGIDEIEKIATTLYGHSLYVERWKRECVAIMLHRGIPDEYRGLLPERSSKGTRIGISRSLMAKIEPIARALVAQKEGETP